MQNGDLAFFCLQSHILRPPDIMQVFIGSGVLSTIDKTLSGCVRGWMESLSTIDNDFKTPPTHARGTVFVLPSGLFGQTTTHARTGNRRLYMILSHV